MALSPTALNRCPCAAACYAHRRPPNKPFFCSCLLAAAPQVGSGRPAAMFPCYALPALPCTVNSCFARVPCLLLRPAIPFEAGPAVFPAIPLYNTSLPFVPASDPAFFLVTPSIACVVPV